MGEAKYNVDDHGFLVDLQDLKKSYRATHRMIADLKRRLESDAEKGDHEAEGELNTIKGMITDVNFAIEWLHTGRQPGTKRGIERRSVYQNTVLLDPSIMASFANPSNSRSGSSLTEDQKSVLRDVLELLSPQEKECYVMAHGHGISHEQVATMLGISKGSVTTYIKRAHEKVSKGWQGSLF